VTILIYFYNSRRRLYLSFDSVSNVARLIIPYLFPKQRASRRMACSVRTTAAEWCPAGAESSTSLPSVGPSALPTLIEDRVRRQVLSPRTSSSLCSATQRSRYTSFPPPASSTSTLYAIRFYVVHRDGCSGEAPGQAAVRARRSTQLQALLGDFLSSSA
jgi:hypothetical protein